MPLKQKNKAIKRQIKKEYYPDGSLKAEKTYLNGKLHGTSRFYSRDGALWAIQKSKNGIKESMELCSLDNTKYSPHNKTVPTEE